MATQFLGRSAWADSDWQRGGAQLTGEKLVGAAVHWPGTTQSTIGDPGQASIRNRLRSYYEFHVESRGWSDIGYNFAIDQGGRVWDLRGLGRVGAHCASTANPDANHEFLGVLFIVGANERPTFVAIQAFIDLYFDVILPRWPGRDDVRGHGQVPGASTACPGEAVLDLVTSGALTDRDDVVQEELTVSIDLNDWDPVPQSASLTGTVLDLTFHVANRPPDPVDPVDPPSVVIPPRPSNDKWRPGVSHSSFTAMGERFLKWLSNDEISRAGSVYRPGPTYSDYDDFNVRKIQHLIGDTPDPVGEAFLGPKQWEFLFSQDRPAKSSLPADLRGQQPPQNKPDPDPDPSPEPDPTPQLPSLPDEDRFEPGVSHSSFTAMGERFKLWLRSDEISHDGDGYQPGPVYSDFDDFNVRKIQALMGNSVDPAGRAYFGPKQWELLFSQGRPSGASLPSSLQGRVPPQLDDAPTPPPSNTVPTLPGSSLFEPGKRHSSFTDMGERFKAWLKSDEIHKAGSVYTPGPVYSVYDDRNVRAVQYLMGDTPDPVGREFLGPKQWERLFTEGRPNRTLPDSLKPGGSGGGGGGGTSSSLIPVRGQRITQHYGVPGSWAAGKHTGVDLGSNGDDTIRCVASGTVVAVGTAGDWGKRVIVRHGNGRYSWYCHLRSISVRKGQSVRRGQKLGMMGETGRTFGKHLHYQESSGGYGYWDFKRPIMLDFGGY